MKIIDKFKEKELVVSLEIFPPNNRYPMESIFDVVEELSQIDTDYISVTYEDFGITAACYPKGHLETKIKDLDIDDMKFKEEAGADYFISQLFSDNNLFYYFLNKVEKKGIRSPIQAGIMPVINLTQVKRTVELSGAHLPEKFIKILEKYKHDELALRDAGIAYAVEQIVDLELIEHLL